LVFPLWLKPVCAQSIGTFAGEQVREKRTVTLCGLEHYIFVLVKMFQEELYGRAQSNYNYCSNGWNGQQAAKSELAHTA
jgi:hypothetical protein